MELTHLHYIVAFLAMAINTINKVRTRKDKTPLSFKFYFQRNWMDLAISIMSIVALFLMINEITILLQLSGFSEQTIGIIKNASLVVAFIIGWYNFNLVKKAMGRFKEKTT